MFHRFPVLLAVALALTASAIPVDATQSPASPNLSTLLGGGNGEEGTVVDLGPDGHVYVAGVTSSTSLSSPTGSGGPYQVFVARLSPDLQRLEWANVFGGSQYDAPFGLRVSSDTVYVAGVTASNDFPTTGSIVYDRTPGGEQDGFLAAFTTSGAWKWSTRLGGSSVDAVQDLELDNQGRPVVGGWTESCDFYRLDGAYRQAPTGCSAFSGDGFLMRFWTDGALHRLTLFGGSGTDRITGISVSPASGAILLTGSTASTNLPVPSTAAQSRPADVFVAKMDEGMQTLSYATYLGGTGENGAWDVARDADGNAVVTGWTLSNDFPTTAGAYRRTFASPTGCQDTPVSFNGPCTDAFVTKLDPTGSHFAWSTYLGGSKDDQGRSVAVASDGTVYVGGFSDSGDSFLPAKSGERGFRDAFVAGLSADGTNLAFLAGLSGSDWDEAASIDVGAGRAWATGFTWSADYPTTVGAYDRSLGGSTDAFVSAFDIPNVPPQVTFDHRGGNEWWVEASITGPVAAVQARDTDGPWVNLEKKSWGNWAATFHVEPGHQVQFQAMADGQWIASCWFSHPDGLEQCSQPGTFTASFSDVKGNEWWIEARVVANQPVSRVDVSLNGGTPQPLDRTSWGAWAKSYHAPGGTIVRFFAWSTTGGGPVASACYRWTSADIVPCPTTQPAPAFDHRGGNEWWVEAVVAGATPSRVLSRDTDGPWVEITLRSWGSWAGSYHIEPGHDVQFRALVDGAWWESCWFTHPDGAARTGGTTCPGTKVA